MDNTTFLIINTLEFVFLGLFIYFKSYSAKKGENQATKEDIGEITRIAESIKSSLIDNTEKLKADLARKNEYLIDMTAIEKEAILAYYKELYGFIKYLLRVSLSSYDLDSYLEIDSVRINIESEFRKYDLAEAYIELFLDDSTFITAKSELNYILLALINIINVNVIQYKALYINASTAIEFRPNDELEIIQKLNNESLTRVQQFNGARLETYKELLPCSNNVKAILKKRLAELLS